MENKNVIVLVVVLVAMVVPTLAADSQADHSDGGADRSDGGNEALIGVPGGVSFYKKSPLSRFFLPKGYLPDRGLGCLKNGEFCLTNPMGCCGNCGCLIIPGICYGTDC